VTDHLRAHDAAMERLKALHPKKIDLSLGRIEDLLDKLGRPQHRLPPTIHVAGTNGKGSTVAFVRAIAEAAGLKVHAYTSPHLVRFAERIRLAGALIADEALSEILARVEAANAGAPITFFEITAAAAFLAFAETPADLLVLEVGLGGRFDATNVIGVPAVSVIAPVDYDHAEFLGTDLAGIAREKAGILKAGAPAVVARQQPEALAAIEAEAGKLGVELQLAGRDFDAYADRGRLAVQLGDRLLDLPAPNLFGRHQYDNAGLAVAAVAAWNNPRIGEDAYAKGVAGAYWPGRMQRLTGGPLGAMCEAAGADLWLDGGHNPHAARALADALGALKARDGRPVCVVAGLLGNKDAAGFFQAMAPLGPHILTVDFEAEAAADARDLAQVARAAGLSADACPDVTAAVGAALARGGPAPHVCIAGSLYLAGEVLALSPETYPV
jgi:dihydrofolate synthase/folylpolyglutamate synthase